MSCWMYEVLSNDLTTQAADLVNNLIIQGGTISTAESCTGGLLSAAITEIPGSSKVFSYGFVTYANEAKTKLIGVSSELIELYGAVSEQVARAMAAGAMQLAKSDVAVAITGIAGPAGGSEQKPVGLVYISIASEHSTTAKKLLLTGNRQEIRLKAAIQAIKMAIDIWR